MGLLHDMFFEARMDQIEKDLKEAYSMGFRDGRLCPADLRPCTVDGAPALFHRFVENDKGVLQIGGFIKPDLMERILKDFNEKGVCPGSCTVEKLRQTTALIEWPDGRLCTVAVERIQFTDRSGTNPLEDVRTSDPVMGKRW